MTRLTTSPRGRIVKVRTMGNNTGKMKPASEIKKLIASQGTKIKSHAAVAFVTAVAEMLRDPCGFPEHCVRPVDVPADTKDHEEDPDSTNIGTGAMDVGKESPSTNSTYMKVPLGSDSILYFTDSHLLLVFSHREK
ncbi:hypothetical protein STEG23_038333, partial [Scotinomys teguina]